MRFLPRRRGALDLLAALALLLLPWLLYGSSLGLWWTEDDFFQLRFAERYGPRQYTLEPAVWQRLPNRVLTPLLFASYDLDLEVAGLDPPAFYAHQLLALGMAALALYALLRLWLGAGPSLLAGIVFLLGPPVASLAPLLMVRHYPEALTLALAATLLFVVGARRNGLAAGALAVLSALVYLVACLAKEIALPLPAVLACLPTATPRRRLQGLTPHLVVLGIYTAYRRWMLGGWLGGYGWVVPPGEWPRVLFALPWRLARELVGPSAWGWPVPIVLGTAAILLARRNRWSAALVVAALVAVLLPLVPVALAIEPRLAVAAWLLLAAVLAPAAAAGLSAVGTSGGRTAVNRRRWAALAIVVLLAAALAANRAAWRQCFGRAEQMSVENRGLLALAPGDVLRHPAGTPSSLAELARFARQLLADPTTGAWFEDDLYLCPPKGAHRPPLDRLWEYVANRRELVDVTANLPAIRRRSCGAIRWDAPLAASFRSEEGVLSWRLGPYRDEEGGAWAFVAQAGRIRYEVPRRGAFRDPSRLLRRVRVRFASPAGWVTYSPPLALGSSATPELRWSRP